MLVKQILGTKAKKGAVWLLQLLKAAVLLWPFRWIRHEVVGRVYFRTSDSFKFCTHKILSVFLRFSFPSLREFICAVTLLIKVVMRWGRMKIIIEVTQETFASIYNLFLLCACYYGYYYEQDKKSMGYSCEPRTEAALYLSQALWERKVLKNIINLGWVAWLTPVLYLLKWKTWASEIKRKHLLTSMKISFTCSCHKVLIIYKSV